MASDKGVLHRVLREKGAVIDSEGLEALRRLPETFREWVSVPPARRFKVGHSAIPSVVVGRGLPLHPNEAVTEQETPHDIEADFSARGRLMRAFRRVFLSDRIDGSRLERQNDSGLSPKGDQCEP